MGLFSVCAATVTISRGQHRTPGVLERPPLFLTNRLASTLGVRPDKSEWFHCTPIQLLWTKNQDLIVFPDTNLGIFWV